MFVRSIFGSLLAIGLAATPAFAGSSDDVSWTSYLDDAGINGLIDQLAEPRNYVVKQVSSYDTSGGAADDSGAVEHREREIVLARLEGPGAITRFWVKNLSGSLRVYVDNVEHPVIMSHLEDFFGGTMNVESRRGDIWVEPLIGESGGGYYCYVPIPYQDRCAVVVETTEPSFSYQITYAEFPEDTPLASFHFRNTREDKKYFDAWMEDWNTAHFQRSKRKVEEYRHSRHHYFPGKNVLLYVEDGPAVITELEFMAESASEDVLQNAWLEITFDGQEEPSVLCPLADFFGAPMQEAGNFTSLPLGRDGTRMWNRFPMPYRNSVEMRIINGSDQILDLEYYIVYEPGDVGNQRYFMARQNAGTAKAGDTYRVANIRGTGHLAGVSLSATGGTNLDFLSGDDMIRVDDRGRGNFHGTGTDDFFNAGWFFTENPFDAPVTGGSYKSASSPTGFSAVRGFVTDTIPFSESLVFDIENGDGGSGGSMEYSSVVYWYQDSPNAPLRTVPAFDKVKDLYALRR